MKTGGTKTMIWGKGNLWWWHYPFYIKWGLSLTWEVSSCTLQCRTSPTQREPGSMKCRPIAFPPWECGERPRKVGEQETWEISSWSSGFIIPINLGRWHLTESWGTKWNPANHSPEMSLLLKTYLFLFYVFGCLPLWMSVHHVMPSTHLSQKWASDAMELKLHIVMCCRVGAGNWAQVLWKNTQGAKLLSHLSSPTNNLNIKYYSVRRVS